MLLGEIYDYHVSDGEKALPFAYSAGKSRVVFYDGDINVYKPIPPQYKPYSFVFCETT